MLLMYHWISDVRGPAPRLLISGFRRLKLKLSLLPFSKLVSGMCKNRDSLVLIWGELF